MSYKQIYSEIWTDPWFLDLPLSTKMLYIYLFSNERANVLGLYEISRRAIAFETNMTSEQVSGGLTALDESGKVKTNGTWVWIPKLLTRNTNNLKSELTQKHIAGLILAVPDSCPFREDWHDFYNERIAPRYDAAALPDIRPSPPEAPSDAPQAPSKPLASPLHGALTNNSSSNNTLPLALPPTLPPASQDNDLSPPATADKPPTPQPPENDGNGRSKKKKPDPLSDGQRGFLEPFGAIRFKTIAQRNAVLALEDEHGIEKLLEAATWAAERGMSVGKAVGSVRTALPKWGAPKIISGQTNAKDRAAEIEANIKRRMSNGE